MSVQIDYLKKDITDDFKEDATRTYLPPEKAPVKSTIVTLGEVIGMIKMVLSSIIDAIDKAGNVGKDYLQTNLRAMEESAKYKKKAAQDSASGSFWSAAIGIGLTGAGMFGNINAMKSHVNNASKMNKIQSAPIGEPPRNIGIGVQGRQIPERDLIADKRLADKGGMTVESELSKVHDKTNQNKVLHGKAENATSYSSEAERERAFKIQQELNNRSDKLSGVASAINSQSMPLGSVVDARKKDDAAKAQHASDIEGGVNEGVRTLQNENNNFYGSLSGLLDKLGIANIVTQAVIAASQWK